MSDWWIGLLFDWWIGLDGPLKAATVTAGATVISSIVGFTAVFIQIGRQGRNAINANRQNEALKRKAAIYERTLETSDRVQEAVSALTVYLAGFGTEVRFASKLAADQKHPWNLPQARFPEYQRLSHEATSAITDVMTMVDNWRIIDPRLVVFRRALAMGFDGLVKVTLHSAASYVYAMPVQGYETNWQPPDEATAAALQKKIDAEIYEIGRLGAWVADFQAEMQLLLLGELFPNGVERRNPPDPNQFCIRLDRHKEISERIDGSDWGKRAAAQDQEARLRFMQNKGRSASD